MVILFCIMTAAAVRHTALLSTTWPVVVQPCKLRAVGLPVHHAEMAIGVQVQVESCYYTDTHQCVTVEEAVLHEALWSALGICTKLPGTVVQGSMLLARQGDSSQFACEPPMQLAQHHWLAPTLHELVP